MSTLQTFREWRRRRYWAKRHLEFVRQMVSGDARWLASEPVASLVMERYESILSSDWYRRQHTDIRAFREQVRAAIAKSSEADGGKGS